jgi:hypothetical protein
MQSIHSNHLLHKLLDTHPSLLSRGSARPKNLAAIQLLPNTSEWISAKIISYDKSTKTYTLSDEDALSTEIYFIPSLPVIALNKSSVYTRGDVAYAVYPDTTLFYLATVSTSKNNFVMVHFRDDGMSTVLRMKRLCLFGWLCVFLGSDTGKYC